MTTGRGTLVNTENTISLKSYNTSQVSAIACRLMLTGGRKRSSRSAHYNDKLQCHLWQFKLDEQI